MDPTAVAGRLVVALLLLMIALSVAITAGPTLLLWLESRRWRSRYKVAAAESRRWRRDPGHPGGHVAYARSPRPDRRHRA